MGNWLSLHQTHHINNLLTGKYHHLLYVNKYLPWWVVDCENSYSEE
jgi:hypothetical protein